MYIHVYVSVCTCVCKLGLFITISLEIYRDTCSQWSHQDFISRVIQGRCDWMRLRLCVMVPISCHPLHRRWSKWLLPVKPVPTTSSAWRRLRFSGKERGWLNGSYSIGTAHIHIKYIANPLVQHALWNKAKINTFPTPFEQTIFDTCNIFKNIFQCVM